MRLHNDCPALVHLSPPTVALVTGESGHIWLTIEAAGLEGQSKRVALVFGMRTGAAAANASR